MLLFILTIIAKTVIIELAIELLRQALYAVTFNAWAGRMLVGTNKHPQFDWWLNILESVFVVALLLMNFSMLFIIILVFLLMLLLKELGNRLIAR